MQEIELSGHRFSPTDLDLVTRVTKRFSTLSLTELSKTLCELLAWKRSNGKLKYEECRAFLEKLQAENLISLPGVRKMKCTPRRIPLTQECGPQAAVTCTLQQYEPLSLRLVQACDGPLYALVNQYIQRYHYLICRVSFGAQARYLVQSRTGSHLACLDFLPTRICCK